MKNRLCVWLCLGAAALLVSCGGSQEGDVEEVGEVTEALAPAGSNALFVPGSSTFPASFYPGERRHVTIAMQNTGSNPATNTWLTAGPPYTLVAKNAFWNWALTRVPSNTPVGSTAAFTFLVTAPATAQPFDVQMRANIAGQADFFGPIVNLTPTVSTSTQPHWGCRFEAASSTLPTTMAPGETRLVTLTVTNFGSQTWTAGNSFALAPRDTPINLWNSSYSFVKSVVTSGQTTTFTFGITAPATPGTYKFQREMRSFGVGPGDFRLSDFCIDQSIDVGGTPPLASELVSATFASPVTANSVGNSASITFKNIGLETWTAGSTDYVLYSQNSPANFWGITLVPMPANTPSGSNVTINFAFRAPATAGTFPQTWQLRKISGVNAGFFGASTAGSTSTVTAGQAAYDATVVSQTIPTLMTSGKNYSFDITMRNSGSTAWSGNRFGLSTINSPVGLWGVLFVPLGASETVASGADRLFSVPVTAPATPGTYTSNWGMRSLDIGFFGANAATGNLVVTLCGNNVIDAGENCDDDNLVNDDGCSNTCQQEQTVVDPGDSNQTQPARTLLGSGSGMQGGTVVFGDVTGDGSPEVFISETQAPPPLRIGRSSAGAVYGFPGGSGFVNGSTTTNPTGATLQIAGADFQDSLGIITSPRIVVADVSGDAIGDLIVSAHLADGPANGRSNAGEVWVFTGSPSLISAGLIDLRTPPPSMRTHITGAAAGSAISAVAAGDLTGDGNGDLLIASAGVLYVLSGGPALVGEIDLAALPAGVTLTSINAVDPAVDTIGDVIAIGDINGDSVADLMVGAPNAAPGGKLRAGAAYAKFGPITSNVFFADAVGSATGPSVVWLGRNNTDGLGRTVAIGNVTGTSDAEVLVGGIQYQRGGAGPQGGGVHIWSNVTSGTIYDEVTATPTAMITGARQGDNCGTTLKLGDVNADGIQDIFLGCSAGDGPTQARTNAGEVNVIFGAATLPADYDLLTRKSRLVLYGNAPSAFLGRYVATLSVGDLDGDGAADFCAGSIVGANPGYVNCVVSPF